MQTNIDFSKVLPENHYKAWNAQTGERVDLKFYDKMHYVRDMPFRYFDTAIEAFEATARIISATNLVKF